MRTDRRTDGQTDGQTDMKGIIAFRNIGSAPKTVVVNRGLK